MCTNIKITSKSNDIFFGRTNDLNPGRFEKSGVKLDIKIAVIPKNIMVESQLESWKSKYSVMGICNLKNTPLNDGVNEHGLAGDSQTLFETTRRKKTDTIEQGKIPLLGEEFVTYVLTNFKNVKELRSSYMNFVLIDQPYKYKGIAIQFPLHYTFIDESGDGIVLEAVDNGRFKLYDYIDVMANSPEYDYHKINIRNYIGLENNGVTDKTLGNNTLLEPIENGNGYGLFGIPGDYTSPSRFIRGFYYKHMIDEFESLDGINRLYGVFRPLIIPQGLEHTKTGELSSDYTIYWAGFDITNRTVYVQTAEGLAISSKTLDTDLENVTYFDVNSENYIYEL